MQGSVLSFGNSSWTSLLSRKFFHWEQVSGCFGWGDCWVGSGWGVQWPASGLALLPEVALFRKTWSGRSSKRDVKTGGGGGWSKPGGRAEVELRAEALVTCADAGASLQSEDQLWILWKENSAALAEGLQTQVSVAESQLWAPPRPTWIRWSTFCFLAFVLKFSRCF